MRKKKTRSIDSLCYGRVKKIEIDSSYIFALCKLYNVSQADLASLSDVSPSALQRIRVNPHKVALGKFIAIINAFNRINPDKKHKLEDIIKQKY